MISGYQKRDGTNGSTNLTSAGRHSHCNGQIHYKEEVWFYPLMNMGLTYRQLIL